MKKNIILVLIISLLLSACSLSNVKDNQNPDKSIGPEGIMQESIQNNKNKENDENTNSETIDIDKTVNEVEKDIDSIKVEEDFPDISNDDLGL